MNGEYDKRRCAWCGKKTKKANRLIVPRKGFGSMMICKDCEPQYRAYMKHDTGSFKEFLFDYYEGTPEWYRSRPSGGTDSILGVLTVFTAVIVVWWAFYILPRLL